MRGLEARSKRIANDPLDRAFAKRIGGIATRGKKTKSEKANIKHREIRGR